MNPVNGLATELAGYRKEFGVFLVHCILIRNPFLSAVGFFLTSRVILVTDALNLHVDGSVATSGNNSVVEQCAVKGNEIGLEHKPF